MEITDKMRNDLLGRSGRRCECVSKKCRHHRPATRCPKGLRTDGWSSIIGRRLLAPIYGT